MVGRDVTTLKDENIRDLARKYLGKSAAEIPWTTKIERPGVMDLITVADAVAKLDALILSGDFR